MSVESTSVSVSWCEGELAGEGLIEEISDIHLAQILTYLKVTNLKLGYLINFNTVLLKNGIKRIVNQL